MAIEGTGTTITMSGFTANITGIDQSGLEQPAIESTHMGSAAREYILSKLIEAGEVGVTIQHQTGVVVPIASGQTMTNVVIDWGGTGAQTSFSGGMTAYNITSAIGEIVTASATIKATGAITII